MEFHVWLAFASASILLLLIPGPTVLLVLSYAISQGRRTALATVAGVGLGDFIAMSASLAGLGALVMTSATLFTILKWVGALYLIYLGVRMLMGAGKATGVDLDKAEAASSRTVFLHATAVTALNPKSIAFFIAFVPQFVTAEAALLPQFAILIATFIGLAVINVLAYAFLADELKRRLAGPALIRLLTRMGGGALIAMGVATAMLRRG